MHDFLSGRNLAGSTIMCNRCNSEMKLRSVNSSDYYCSYCEPVQAERVHYRTFFKVEEHETGTGHTCLSIYFTDGQEPSYKIIGGVVYSGDSDEPLQTCEMGEAMEVWKGLAIFYKDNSNGVSK